jgi:hypothetical protein
MFLSCGDLSIEDESIANFQEQEEDEDGLPFTGPSFDIGDTSSDANELDFSRFSIDSAHEDIIRRDSRLFNIAQEEMRKYQNQKSQLNLIFDLIGTPNLEDLLFLDDRNRAMLLAIDKKPRKVSYFFHDDIDWLLKYSFLVGFIEFPDTLPICLR